MNETQEHLTAKEDEISDAENELIQAQIAEDDQYDSMKRGSVIFMKAVIHSFEMMMTSSSITDLLNKASMWQSCLLATDMRWLSFRIR